MALVTQQISQIGILKAIGATQGRIVQIYLVRVLAYGLLALLIALPLGAMLAYGLPKYLLNIFNIDYEQFQYSLRACLLQVVAAIAVPLSFALGKPMSNALGQVLFQTTLDYQYNFGAVWLWLGLILAISILASLLPVRSATQISVRESLAFG
jgi:putative ABC transport system permease protein